MSMRAWIVTCTMLMAVPTAMAHHPSHVARGPGDGAFIAAQVNVDHASFDIMARRGTWTRLSVEALYAPLSWLEFTTTLPVAWVRERGKDDAFGFSDMELSVITRPYVSEGRRWMLESGLVLELPTGNVNDGLGGGHVALIPKVGFSARPKADVELHGELFVATTLGAHAHGHAPGSWHSMMAIHSLYEFGARAGARYRHEAGQFGILFSTLQGLAEPAAPGPSTVRLRGTVNLTDQWILTGEFEIPFAGQRRVQWRGSLGVGWRLSLEDEEAGCGCESLQACGCESPEDCACDDS